MSSVLSTTTTTNERSTGPSTETMSGEHAEENEGDEEEDDPIFLGELPVDRWREASEATAVVGASAVPGN